MSPRIADKDKRRAQILEATLEVIAARGAFDFKIIEIAKQAGIGKGTIYEYFKSKDDILFEAFAHFLRKNIEYLHARQQKNFPPREKLKNYIRNSIRYFVDNRNALKVMFDFWAYLQNHRKAEEFFDHCGDIMVTYKEDIKNIIEEGQRLGEFRDFNSEVAKTILFATLDGLALQYHMQEIDLADDRTVELLIDLIMGGLINDGN